MEKSDVFWLSPQQERLWSLEQEARGSPYRVEGAILLTGEVQAEKLRDALRGVVGDHDILRARFVRPPGMKMPFQAISRKTDLIWQTPSVMASTAEDDEAELFTKLSEPDKTFSRSLEAGPVLHAHLLKLARTRHLLIVRLPALCADAWTMTELLGDLARRYDTQLPAAEDEIQYVQFAQWQKELLEVDDERSRAGRAYWRKQDLLSFRSPALPFEKKGEEGTRLAPAVFRLLPDPPLLSRIKASDAKHGTSIANCLLAAWQVLLWRLSRQARLAVDTLFRGREYEEFKSVFGLFSRHLPVVARFDADYRFHEVWAQLARVTGEMTEWQEYFPPDALGSREDAFAFEYLELGEEVKAGELRMRLVNLSSCTERFKVKLVGLRRPEGLSLELHYDSRRYGRPAIARLGEQLARLLDSALAEPERPVSELEILSGDERQRLLVEWNQSERAYPAEETIVSLFAAQAHETPERVAVVGGGQAISYGELERRANRLAQLLRRHGVGADGLVGLCVERSPELVVGILGILKAGGAYVPLSTSEPKLRLAQQLAGAQALVSESSVVRQLPEFTGVTVCLDRDAGLLAEQPETAPCPAAKAEHLVYVIYTSGSTGVPKGVEIEHRNLVNYARFMAERLHLEQYAEGLQFATVSTIAADLGNSCIYPALVSGGTIHLVSHEMASDAARLGRYVEEQGIDVLKIVPSHLAALLAGEEGGQVLPGKYLITGGEALSGRLLERIAQFEAQCQVINHYGPTETTVGSLTFEVGEAGGREWESATVPIGRPIANTRVYILDEKGQAVPVGVAGELYIAGAGVGRGYRNQPERTAERFLSDPFVARAGARMYRTGDLARYREDGVVEFLGRADDQVKVRGYRIELGEIEAVLAAHGNVKQAVVLAREDSGTGEKCLAGYVVLRQPAARLEELRQHLRQHLPEYMVPAALVRLDKLPLNANGKVDREALPAPDAVRPGGEGTYVAPRSAVEQELARIWAEVLGRQRVGVEDNFFDLGGHSLLATQVISRIRERFHIELALHSLFENPTVSGLAIQIESIRAQGDESIEKKTISRVSREQYRVNSN